MKMGKYIIPLLIIFFACLILGYLTTGDLLPKEKPQQTLTNSNQSIFRINLIVVVVDDLIKPRPNPISVWGIFINIDKNQFMEVAYILLYPVSGSLTENGRIENLFSIESNRSLSTNLLKYLAETYSFPWDSYVILDRIAITFLSDSITGIPANFSENKPSISEDEQVWVGEQETLLQDICQSLNEDDFQGKPPLDWKTIMPEHFLTNQPVQTLLANWEMIIKTQKPGKCKLLTNQ
jgi:hypothetical protein